MESPSAVPSAGRPKVALVLGSGGIKCIATLGLFRMLAREKIPVDLIAASSGGAVFATAYRSTLQQGQRDQASFQVPLDYTASEGSQLVQPADPSGAQPRHAAGMLGRTPPTDDRHERGYL